ncbi:hypothetical protein Q9966_016532 [Columba livia]|nr:hypothetical protein Q9966_016532 [Columba livia]
MGTGPSGAGGDRHGRTNIPGNDMQWVLNYMFGTKKHETLCCFPDVSGCESAENITALGHGIGRADRASQLDPGYEPWAVPEVTEEEGDHNMPWKLLTRVGLPVWFLQSMVIKPLGVILFLSLGAIPGVSDQVKKAETSRPVCSPVTGQESGCGMDLPTGSSTKVAAPKDSKLATLKSSLLASAALELNITMSPPPAMRLVLSAKKDSKKIFSFSK